MIGWLNFGFNVASGVTAFLIAMAVAKGWAPPSSLIVVGFALLGLTASIDALWMLADLLERRPPLTEPSKRRT